MSQPQEGKVFAEILKCHACGALAIYFGDEGGGERITHHKCAGRWDAVLQETVKAQRVIDAINSNNKSAD